MNHTKRGPEGAGPHAPHPSTLFIFVWFYSLKKSDCDFDYKLGICDFIRKSGKLAIQIKDNYYINWKNAKIRKIYDNLR